jgi:hypothetical protein
MMMGIPLNNAYDRCFKHFAVTPVAAKVAKTARKQIEGNIT